MAKSAAAKAASPDAFTDLMAQFAGTKSTAKPKSSVPTVDAPESLRPAIAEWIEAARALKAAEAKKKGAEGKMCEDATKLRVRKCRQDHQYYASIRLDGKASGAITMVQTGKWLKMDPAEHQDALLAAFGDEGFAKYFNVQTSMEVDVDAILALKDGSAILAAACKILFEKLLAAGCTPEQIRKMVKQPKVISPNEQYLHDAVFNEKVAEKAEQCACDGHAVLYKPSFRL
jgi:hypothetical protein